MVWLTLIVSILIIITSLILFGGFFTLQPNEAHLSDFIWRIQWDGSHQRFSLGKSFLCQWGIFETRPASGYKRPAGPISFQKNPYKLSLRASNFNSDKLKVNDKRGNPIEIAAVVVWRIPDTAQAIFDVDDYENYVKIQSESAIRHLASAYAYDHGEENEHTLRSSTDEVSRALA